MTEFQSELLLTLKGIRVEISDVAENTREIASIGAHLQDVESRLNTISQMLWHGLVDGDQIVGMDGKLDRLIDRLPETDA